MAAEEALPQPPFSRQIARIVGNVRPVTQTPSRGLSDDHGETTMDRLPKARDGARGRCAEQSFRMATYAASRPARFASSLAN
jgi:hypothetical protein